MYQCNDHNSIIGMPKEIVTLVYCYIDKLYL